jgi:hypothetical protein
VGYTHEELAARRRRRRRRGHVRLAAILLVAGAATAFAFALLRNGPEATPAGAEPETPAPVVPTTSAAEGPEGEPEPSAPAREPPSRVVRIAAVGDIAMGRTPVLPPDGGASLFAGVRGALRGEVVLGNLEQALTDVGASKCAPREDEEDKDGDEREAEPQSCFAFRTPPAYAVRLRRAGFTMLNLANNHSFDFGQAGLDSTVAALEAEKLSVTGRPGEIARVRAKRVRIAVLGFAPYATAQNMLDLPGAKRLVRRADRWADLVVVTMHAGAEGAGAERTPRGPESYLGEPRGDVRAFARAVVDAGADLVVGHGPHVLRGMEWYRGRLVAYSLGNFAGYRTLNAAGPGAVSAVLRVSLRGDGAWKSGRLVPLRLDATGTPAVDPAGEALGLVRRLSREDFGRRAVRVSRDGEISPPG